MDIVSKHVIEHTHLRVPCVLPTPTCPARAYSPRGDEHGEQRQLHILHPQGSLLLADTILC